MNAMSHPAQNKMSYEKTQMLGRPQSFGPPPGKGGSPQGRSPQNYMMMNRMNRMGGTPPMMPPNAQMPQSSYQPSVTPYGQSQGGGKGGGQRSDPYSRIAPYLNQYFGGGYGGSQQPMQQQPMQQQAPSGKGGGGRPSGKGGI
jgi:hypothetical protein